MNATDPIRQHARSTPDAPAFILDDRPPLSYADYDAVLDAIARRLLDAGVRPGHSVALAVHRDFALFTLGLALARIGATGFASKAPEDPCDFRVVSRGVAPSPHAPTLQVDKLWFQAPAAGARGAPLATHQDGTALFHIFRTSGTTGRAKALGLSHDDILSRADRRRRALSLPQPGRAMTKVRPAASYGFQFLLRVLLEGGAIVDAPALDDVPGAIGRHRVNYLVMPPGILSAMIARMPPGIGPFPSLEFVEISGSRLTDQLAELAFRRVSPNLITLYGSTEAGLIAIGPVRDILGIPGAVGRLIPGVVVQIVDDAGNPLPPDTEGTLRLRDDGGHSYYGDSGPATAFRDGWFYSGDLARLTHDGMLVIGGRADQIINVGGGKVAPEKLEHKVLAFPGVADVAAFAVPSRTANIDRVAMAIVIGPGFDFATFQARCREELGVFAPETVLRMDAIPRNENGKINRQDLQALAAAHAAAPAR